MFDAFKVGEKWTTVIPATIHVDLFYSVCFDPNSVDPPAVPSHATVFGSPTSEEAHVALVNLDKNYLTCC